MPKEKVFSLSESDSETTRSWVEHTLTELQSGKLNSESRNRVERSFVEAVSLHPMAIPALVRELEQLSGYTFSQKLVRLITSESAVNGSVHKLHTPPGRAEVSLLFQDQAQKELTQRILSEYINMPARMVEKAFRSNGQDWTPVYRYAIDVGFSLLASMNDASNKDETIQMVIQILYENAQSAERNSFISIISVISKIDDPGFSREAGALQTAFMTLMVIYLHLSEAQLTDVFSHRFSPELFMRINPTKEHNPFIEEWNYRAVQFAKFIEEKQEGTLGWLFPSEKNEIINFTNKMLVELQRFYIKQDPDFESWNINMPDGGNIFLARWISDNSTFRKEELHLYLHGYYSIQIDRDPHFVEDEEIQKLFLEAMTPTVDQEKLKNQIIASRERAAGGFSTISERGDKVKITDQGNAEELYLHNLGIRECVFYQTGNGIQAELLWFTNKFEFSLNDHYELVGCEHIEKNVKSWIEELLLQYIASIKNQLFESQIPLKKGGDGAGKVFAGRRPHLRVLPLGQKTSLTLPSHRGEKMNEDEEAHYLEEMHKFILFHFGVSLETINNVFESIQQDLSLTNVDNFQVLFKLYEEELPDGYKALATWLNAKAIVKEAMRRTVNKETKVHYSREKGLLVKKDNEYIQSHEFFQLTLVNEAKSHSLDVQPMVFNCDTISAHMRALATGNLPEDKAAEDM